MPRRPHLELFNPNPSASGDASFQFFQNLPAEIRIIIWSHALERNRLLRLVLERRRKSPSAPRYTLLNSLGRPVTGNHYRVVLKAKAPFLSELMQVNRESRDVAGAFYTAQIPCYVETGSRREKTVLRLNFDWDYLDIMAGSWWKEAYMDFIYDLRASDPRGRGLRHLVVDEIFGDESTTPTKPSDFDSTALDAFKSAMSNLESLWYMCVDEGGRAFDRPMHPNGMFSFNYAFPIFPAFTFFERPVRDPRDISTCLTKNGDGMQHLALKPFGWALVLRNLGVDLGPAVEVRIMVGSMKDDVRTRAGASQHLHEEDFEWLRYQWWFRGWDRPEPRGGGGSAPAGCMATVYGLTPVLPSFDGPEILAAAPRPAVGFWLFRPTAIGIKAMAIRRPGGTSGNLRGDDRDRHWPDLALACIR
ncbi:pectinesterase precursor [Colletotrichum plurivorum]|uniref:Pectinesterase n=1 Tax=Colletotrichum plurivorum TaxID=2175906 RepID=A0A8H6KQP4_9PEZI|nr:pectinesterase precursor [Colletotrichum plurivorum]